MAQIGRRVKTTQELLEDLKHRDTGGPPPATPVTDVDEFRRSKTEHLAKFLNSQAEHERPVKSRPALSAKSKAAAPPPLPRDHAPSGPGSPTSRTVAEILSVLPPIDLSVLDDPNDEYPEVAEGPSAASEALIERVLAGEQVQGVTGNREEEGEGDKTEHAFKEWHESVWRRSFDGQPLLVWPYVITD